MQKFQALKFCITQIYSLFPELIIFLNVNLYCENYYRQSLQIKKFHGGCDIENKGHRIAVCPALWS